MNTIDEINIKVNVDSEEVEEATDKINDLADALDRIVPNVTVKNNKAVYVTINNWNASSED